MITKKKVCFIELLKCLHVPVNPLKAYMILNALIWIFVNTIVFVIRKTKYWSLIVYTLYIYTLIITLCMHYNFERLLMTFN